MLTPFIRIVSHYVELPRYSYVNFLGAHHQPTNQFQIRCTYVLFCHPRLSCLLNPCPKLRSFCLLPSSPMSKNNIIITLLLCCVMNYVFLANEYYWLLYD
jgi:hypothetical protein